MHEMALCESVLNVLQAEAAKQGFSKVTAVWLELGDLAAVEVNSFRFCFDVVIKHSLASDADLHIIHVSGEGWCFDCEQSVSIKQKYASCPLCGGYQLKITNGDQMRIKSLEVN